MVQRHGRRNGRVGRHMSAIPVARRDPAGLILIEEMGHVLPLIQVDGSQGWRCRGDVWETIAFAEPSQKVNAAVIRELGR